MSDFIHLHNHSHYSILDGIIKIDELIAKTREFNQTAVALTDHGNMFGAFEFFKAANDKDKLGNPFNIKPIYGAELYIAPKSRFEKNKTEKYHHLVLLAKDMEGYRNLIKLCSIGYQEGFYSKPRIDRDVLETYSKGLIGMSACIGGEIPKMILDNNENGLNNALDFYTEVFGKENFFLEIQDHKMPEEKTSTQRMIEISKKTGLGLVATNDCHYINEDDAILQEVAFAILDKTTLKDEKHRAFPSREFYLKSPEQMEKLFESLPESISNTKKIAEMCNVLLVKSNVQKKLNMHTPVFPLPEGETPDSFLDKKSKEGMVLRFKGKEVPQEYQDRLALETSLIQKMGFSNYFLIVSDFVQFAKGTGILVGPGRGSAAGALLSYSLSITDVDPIRYALLFERFLNPERVSMPDIDIDFQDDRRDEVKEYIRAKYGYSRTADIITFGVMKSRAALKDVGRVLDIPLEKVNGLTKQIDNKMANEDLSDVIAQVPELKKIADTGTELERQWLDYSVKLDGTIRNVGTHASGLIIADCDLTQVVPLYRDSQSGLVSTQFEGTHLEDNGLLKMDILGLSNLTMIHDCLERILINRGVRLDIWNVPLDDMEVFKLFWRGETNGIFQFESGGMTEYLMQLKPTCVDDLIAMNALYRPGPMDNIPSFIARKQGREEIDCFHVNLEPILKSTYGVIVYQEQVMQIAQVLAGFSLGKADVVRRIMAKKKPEELDKIRPEWVDGSVANGYPKELAERIFEILVPFSNYAFNKSHSAAYAILAYQIAYLKTHYRVEFMSSLLTLNMSTSETVRLYCQEATACGIEIELPDINRSVWEFKEIMQPDKKDTILFGFGAIKGLGEGAAQSVIEERELGGSFESLNDFLKRMIKRSDFKKASVEILLKAGCFDLLIPEENFLQEKAVLFHNLDNMLSQLTKKGKEEQKGQLALFGDSSGETLQVQTRIEPLTLKKEFENEVETCGFYLSGRLFKHYTKQFGMVSHCDNDLVKRLKVGTAILVWGFVNEVLTKMTARKQEYAIASVDNGKDSFRIFLFAEKYDQFKRYLIKNDFVVVRMTVTEGKNGPQTDVTSVKPVDSIRQEKFTQLHICLNGKDCPEESAKSLEAIRTIAEDPASKGIIQIVFHILQEKECVDVTSSDKFRVRYSTQLMNRISELPNLLGYWLS